MKQSKKKPNVKVITGRDLDEVLAQLEKGGQSRPPIEDTLAQAEAAIAQAKTTVVKKKRRHVCALCGLEECDYPDRKYTDTGEEFCTDDD